jgi:hypothetical protein
MNLVLLAVALWIAAGSIPPLSPSQRDTLRLAIDGDPTFDAAFEALLENANQWSAGEGDAPVRLHPDLDAMQANPDLFRGDLCRIEGRLEQQSRLPPPHQLVAEWFVRDAAGKPAVVYVTGVDSGGALVDGRHVRLTARFFKRVSFTARDGMVRSYPAFVGAASGVLEPVAAEPPPIPSAASMWWLIVPVFTMASVFGGLLLYARSRRPRGHRAAERVRRDDGAGNLDETAPLPEDPAEALAELKRRAASDAANAPSPHVHD